MFEYLCNSIIFATTDSQDMIKWKGVKFLKFVGAKPSDSEKDFEDAFIRRLQESIREVKASREMGARYMTFQELLNDERIEERRRIAKRMLEKNMSAEEIAELTNMTVEQIMELASTQ